MKYFPSVRCYVPLMIFLCCHLSARSQVNFNKIAVVSPVKPAAPVNLSTNAVLDGVDYATGTLNVSIPIYEVKSRNMSVPIVLNYSANGLRPSNPGSWVGMGWNLEPGGDIVREVRGLMSDGGYANVNTSDLSAYNNTELEKVQNVVNGKWDGEPDVFHYNYPGGGGKFIKKPDGIPLFFPYNPLMKIVNSASESTITDGSGISYVYGERGEVNTWKWKYYDKRKYNYKDSLFYVDSMDIEGQQHWLAYSLNRMVYSNTRDTIYFKYNGAYNPWTGNFTAYSETAGLEKRCYFSGTTFNCFNTYELAEPVISKTSSGNIGSRDFLSDVIFPGGVVKFYTSRNLLDSIRVLASDMNKCIRKVQFYYDTLPMYYEPNISSNNRYKLTKVNFFDGNNNLINSYAFTYYQDRLFPMSTDSRAQDYWGFYNGFNDNQTLLAPPLIYPPIYLSRTSLDVSRKENLAFYNRTATASSVSLANRDPNIEAAVTGTLKSVTSPTGSSYEYTYSLHEFWKYDGSDYYLSDASGLRLADISYYNAAKRRVQRKVYEYGDMDHKGYDRIAPSPITYLAQNYMYGMGADQKHEVTQYMLLSHPLNDLNVYHGSPVVYDKVTEYQQDSMGVNNGKTVYSFQNDALSIGRYVYNLYVRGVNDQIGGLLSNKEYFVRGAGNFYTSISSEFNHYKPFYGSEMINFQKMGMGTVRVGNFDNTTTFSSFCYDAKVLDQSSGQYVWGQICLGSGRTVVDPTAFAYLLPEDPNDKWFYGKYTIGEMSFGPRAYKLDYKQVSGRDGTNTYNKRTEYTYDNEIHLLPTTITETTSTSFEEQGLPGYKKKIRYAQDIATITNPALAVADSIAIRQLIVAGLLNTPVEQETSLNNNFLYKERTDFKVWPGSLILPVRQKVMMGTGAMETVANQQYDAVGNLLEQSKEKDMPLSYIWDYKGLHVIAEVKNATGNDIAYTSFEADGSGNWVIPSLLRDTLNSATGRRSFNMSNAGQTGITKVGLVASTIYKITYFIKGTTPLSITGTQVNIVKGYTNTAGWTCFEHKVTGVTSVKVTGTGLVDELRLYPVMSQMTTTSYTPLIGVTSQCDVRNLITTYEYDAYGRLKVIRDHDGKVLNLYDYQYQVPVNH